MICVVTEVRMLFVIVLCERWLGCSWTKKNLLLQTKKGETENAIFTLYDKEGEKLIQTTARELSNKSASVSPLTYKIYKGVSITTIHWIIFSILSGGCKYKPAHWHT